jgi:hypothetical protein
LSSGAFIPDYEGNGKSGADAMPRGAGHANKGVRHESRQDAEDRLTASLAGLAMALALVVLGLFLTDHLRAQARLEDCLLAGRTNCAAATGAVAARPR